MNNQFSLKVKTPCTENFDNFSTTEKGGFCGSCTKEVIDFTKMNAQEIINHFQTINTQNTCGRFKNHQLKTYNPIIIKRSRMRFINGLAFAFIAFFSFSNGTAQNIESQTKTLDKNPQKLQDTSIQKMSVVKGTVNENGLPLPAVNIILEGTTVGVATDFDGNFVFPEKLKRGDVLVFSYIGYSSKKVVIQNNSSDLDITLEVNLNMDSCVVMGKVAVKKVYKSKKD